ncbi:MAG TPA: hypothetical protein VJ746_00180 [Nitrospira sp.]|nr:hypothetical protein [Nitrospira sp.]
MLHRMALRVLPSLSLAVTEESVRKQKRLVMLVPGLVAFGVYRLAKHTLPLTEPAVLLCINGIVGSVTALLAYRIGRSVSWQVLKQEDRMKRLAWIGGWIGFVYAVQLSLLVLALLWLVGYDYLEHPDGPAMMAIIISCTAVARDAFEIGHVRNLALKGRPFPTFPDGMALRDLLRTHGSPLRLWILAGVMAGALGGAIGHLAATDQAVALVQLSGVTVLGGALALCAYFGGLKQEDRWVDGLLRTDPRELMKYWWWPGLAFASTYYLVLVGVMVFLLRQPGVATPFAVCGGAMVAGVMALYGFYLGYRRHVEEQQGKSLSPALLRCPFVMGILGKSPNRGTPVAAVSGSETS